MILPVRPPFCITRWSEKRQVGSDSVDVELDPPQPDEVTRAVAELLDADAPPPDPWWRAGVDENLET